MTSRRRLDFGFSTCNLAICALMLCFLSALAGCSSDSGEAPPNAGATTTATATTTTTSTTATTTSDAASGSGCTSDSAVNLADGRWFGYVDQAGADEVSFDLACWFSGEAATVAAAEDGEESPPPNDFHIRNVNEQLRDLAVSADAEVSWLSNPSDPATIEVVAYDMWLAARSDRPFLPGVWLTITDGSVTEIEEQYVP